MSSLDNERKAHAKADAAAQKHKAIAEGLKQTVE